MKQFNLSKYPIEYQLTIHFKNMESVWTRETIIEVLEAMVIGYILINIRSGNNNALPKRIQCLFNYYGLNTVLTFFYKYIKPMKKAG